MALARTAGGNLGQVAGDSVTRSFDSNGGTLVLLFLNQFTSGRTISGTPPTVTYNGDAMTAITGSPGAATYAGYHWAFYLLNPSGSGARDFAWTASPADTFWCQAVAYSGNHATTPIDNQTYTYQVGPVSSLECTTSVINSDCWLVVSGNTFWAIGLDGGYSNAATNELATQSSQFKLWDSNGTVATGTKGNKITQTGGTDGGIQGWVISIRPVETTTTSTSVTTTSSSTSITTTSSSTSSSVTTTNSSTSSSITTTSSSTSSTVTTTSSSTSVTTTSSSTSSSTSVTTTSSSISTSSTTTLSPTTGGLAFGEQNPTQGELAVTWKTWDDGSGGAVTVSGDADWGKLDLPAGNKGHSKVYDFGNAVERTITLTKDRYQAGSGMGSLWVRGQADIFAQDDVVPVWELYSGPVNKTWRFIQVKALGE